MTTKPNTQDVPLLSAEDVAGMIKPGLTVGQHTRLLAIADGRAAAYNTATHEIVPTGTREVVERVIAKLRNDAYGQVGWPFGSMRDSADELQRALEGGK